MAGKAAYVNSECERNGERRACPRRSADLGVFAALSPEAALPEARRDRHLPWRHVDRVRRTMGFLPERRMLVSMRIDDFRLNALASVVRCERGSDFRTYVAVKFVDIYEDRLRRAVRAAGPLERLSNSASA